MNAQPTWSPKNTPTGRACAGKSIPGYTHFDIDIRGQRAGLKLEESDGKRLVQNEVIARSASAGCDG